MKNQAVVFIKPHAMNNETVKFVESYFEENKLLIVNKAEYGRNQLTNVIDEHYKILSLGALNTEARRFMVPLVKQREFFRKFREHWSIAIFEKRVMNTAQYFEYNKNSNPEELKNKWDHPWTRKLSLADGLTIGQIEIPGKKPLYVLNGFYPALRSRFTTDDSKVTAYILEFSEDEVSWKDFRNKLIGPSNPEKAPLGSLRKAILDSWQTLNLPYRPNKGDNGVHASAGPVEGLRERLLWFEKDVSLENDEFALSLEEEGINEAEIYDMFTNFDLFEKTKEMGTSRCLEYLSENIDTLN